MFKNFKSILLVLALVASSVGITYVVMSTNNDELIEMSVDIDGPDRIAFGEDAEYNIKPHHMNWFVRHPIWKWKVIEENTTPVHFRELENDKIVLYPHKKAKCYYVIVSGAGMVDLWFHKWETHLGIYVKEVKVGEHPEPGPNPEPDDNKDVPEGKFGISRISYGNFPKKYIKLAKAFQKNYEGAASSIDAGATTNLNQVFGKDGIILNNNVKSEKELGIHHEVVDSWTKILSERLKELFDEHKLSQMNDVSDVLKEIAVGLSYVK